MKRGKQIVVKINFSNRWLYTLIIFGVLIVAGIGVYAASYAASGAGHPYTELTTCSNGQILKMINGAWACGSDVDTHYTNGLYGYGEDAPCGDCNYGTKEPVYASGTTCKCRSGYTLVGLAEWDAGGICGGTYRTYSCVKD